jgi:hypothetical protein
LGKPRTVPAKPPQIFKGAATGHPHAGNLLLGDAVLGAGRANHTDDLLGQCVIGPFFGCGFGAAGMQLQSLR